MKPLADRHALVTGGGTGIGASIAIRLAQQGAQVSLLGRRSEVLDKAVRDMRAMGLDEVAGYTADVTDAASLQAAVEQARQRAGKVQILVANAGSADSKPFHQLDEEHFSQMLAVNLTGVYLSVRSVLPDIRSCEAGRVLVVASSAALKGYAYCAAYCAAKHGAVGLVRALARELAGTSVTVNALCPGFTDTDMTQETVAQIRSATGRSSEQAIAELTRFNPQGRLIDPAEVADAAIWLCGAGAASITGQAIAIAGGEI